MQHCPDAADGLNLGLRRAKSDCVVCMHQDVFLPALGSAPRGTTRGGRAAFGPSGVAGVYGVGPAQEAQGSPLSAERIGCVVDRGRMLRDGPELPARVSTLDELLLVVPRDTPLRFDPNVGFHLYGADLCLQAAERAHRCRAGGAVPSQLTERRIAGGVLRQRGGLRPQVGSPAAHCHPMRRHRPRWTGPRAGQCPGGFGCLCGRSSQRLFSRR